MQLPVCFFIVEFRARRWIQVEIWHPRSPCFIAGTLENELACKTTWINVRTRTSLSLGIELVAVNEQVIQSKQVTQARLLGKCLGGLLAVNLLVVGFSFWTGMSRASVEAKGIVETSPPTPVPTIAEVAKTEIQKTPVPVTVTTPPSVQAHSPAKAVAATPQIASTPPATPPSPSTAAGEATSKAKPLVKTEIVAPAIETPTSPEPKIENLPVSETPATPEPSQPAVIRLVNPGDTGGDVHYAVNRTAYTLSPGEYHEISTETEALVEFHRGGDFGYAKLPLQPADYRFGVGDTGWNLAPALLDPGVTLRRAH
jgi:hypothetical protein